MPSHVSRENYTDEALAECLKIIPCKVFQEVILSLVQDGKGLCRMEVLLDALITVADGSVRNLIDMVGVCKAIVTKIVANRTHTQ